MKWMVPAALLALAGVGLWILIDDGGAADDPDARIDLRGGLEGHRERSPREGAMSVDAPPRVGVIGRAGPADYQGDGDSWRQREFEWPADARRVTGRVLAETVAKHIPVRFANDQDMQEFFAHEFLDHIPKQRNNLVELRQLVKGMGFIEEVRDNFVLLRKDPGTKPPKDRDSR